MESTKKTPNRKANAPESIKKTPGRKPKTVALEPKTPQIPLAEPVSDCCAQENRDKKCCKKGLLPMLMILLLIANLIVGALVICRLIVLQQRIIMGSGGQENLEKLENIYESSEYQEYFAGEIKNLQLKIKNLNPKAE